MDYFNNKVIWITGASSGIGEALAAALVKRKAKLILSSRKEDLLQKVKETCGQQFQENIKILPLDLSNPETFSGLSEKAIQYFGKIDILINNAGISQRSFVQDTFLEVDRKLMEVNYLGTIGLTKTLLPHFLGRGNGHFVTISSLTGKFGTPYRSSYAASKHALHGFFDSLRAELWRSSKDQIPVTLVCPGFVRTNLTLSALTGDGSPLNKMDEAQYKGKSSEWCAVKIIRAIERRKEEVYIGGKEVLGVYLKRFFPLLFSKILRTAKVR